MKMRWLIGIILIVFTIGTVMAVVVIENKEIDEVDVVAVNDVAKTAENQWGHLDTSMFDGADLNLPFVIIDQDEKVLYGTEAGLFTDLYQSIRDRDTIVDIQKDGDTVGKLVVHNNESEAVAELKKELLILVLTILASLLVLTVFYLIFLNRTLLKPFRELQTFASQVARGNLDVPLKMGRDNYFGAFTESFDLMREELSASKQREYESNRSKKELVATLSHDIKTPVASIKAITELMLVQAKDEKAVKHAGTIHGKAEQIDRLVTDLFHATLEELEQLKIKVTDMPSTELGGMIESANLDDRIKVDSIPACIVRTDPSRLQQVLDNVISNAYKYAGTDVMVDSSIDQGYLELRIIDHGPGISEDERPLLFNKYYRGGNVEGKTGAGLGLYISKYFMENMGGGIHCLNREDGFTVVLTIPLA
ncbi:HAMP domain-containing histidine kinase [Rossellomorea marisflavi]|uniref:histidine kinase n=1 Tax=Rossellomorea marisflavi TaxID=189381 RepID=A0A5D4RUZ0_9BACI|nr:HAMP domain-containing sensor histidine kinase [Rossellomorea marisflavi]TYS54730.1 HAMP domain-containing histidine kinase [Rossellomorea marisflavi]